MVPRIVYIERRVLNGISREARRGFQKKEERCGKLIGYRYRDALVIAEASKKGLYSSGRCLPDSESAAELLRAYAERGLPAELIGDWHSHWFEDEPRPSGGDAIAARAISRRYEEYRGSYLMLLIARRKVAAYLYDPGRDLLVSSPLAPIWRAEKFEEEDVLVGSRHGGFWEMLDKTVTIVGLGSGGSMIAYLLAEAGVGSFKLVDPDILAPANVTRHFVGLGGVGAMKVDVVAKMIRDHNPYTSVERFPMKVDEEGLEEIMKGSDLALAMTDSHSSNLYVNDMAVKLGVPLVSAFVGPGSKYADVILVPSDGSRGCYRCVLSYTGISKLNMEAPPRLKAMYGQPVTGALHVNMMPAIFEAVKASLSLLRREDPKYSLLYIDVEKLIRGGLKPIVKVSVPRRIDCPICGGVSS